MGKYIWDIIGDMNMLRIKIPSYLSLYVDKYRKLKCRAWYITKCVSYCCENKIDIYEYYEGIGYDETGGFTRKGKD